jgi:hypothetical protein
MLCAPLSRILELEPRLSRLRAVTCAIVSPQPLATIMKTS